MARFDQILTWIENFLAAATLGAAAVIAITGVILRYVFNSVIFWGEEAVIFLIIFSTFMGAIVTLRHNEHVNVDILGFLLGERGKRWLAVLSAVIIVIYCGVIGFFAWVMITEPAAHNTITPALKLPLWVVELAVPIGLTLMFVRALEVVYRAARGQQTFAEAREAEYGEGFPE